MKPKVKFTYHKIRLDIDLRKRLQSNLKMLRVTIIDQVKQNVDLLTFEKKKKWRN